MGISTLMSLALTLVLTSPASVRAEGKMPKDYRTRVDTLFAEFNHSSTPGAAVVVVKDGRVIMKQGYGQANLEYGVPITPTTPFHIGSVSKHFTAYAVLLLEREGRLALDDDVRKHIKEFPDYGTPITLRHLLHHLSGLRERESLLQLAGITSADTLDIPQLLRLLSRQAALNFKPGDKMEYSNSNYDLLGEVVARVTGNSLRKWTSERIFHPLGMDHTWYADDAGELIKKTAYPYVPNEGNSFTKGLLNHSLVGSTGIVTTAEDMSLWIKHLLSPPKSQAAVVEKLLTVPGRLNNGENTDYGFGLGITDYCGLRVAVHTGMDAGFKAGILVFPDNKLGIAILGNVLSLKTLVMPYRIAEIVLGLKVESKAGRAAEVRDPKTAVDLGVTTLRTYQGHYYSKELETHYTVVEKEGTLIVKHWRNDDAVLTPTSKDTFTSNQSWMRELTFIHDAAGSISSFRLSSGRAKNILFTDETKCNGEPPRRKPRCHLFPGK